MEEKSLLKEILAEVKTMGTDIKDLKSDVTGLKSDMTELKSDVIELQKDVTNIKSDLEIIKINQKEDHQILKALEYSAEVNKTEHDRMNIDIARIQRLQKNMSENLDAMKDIIGRHEIDITVLKKRPV